MTLPGIAGLILSIGMGVDANVITSERIMEEMRGGRTLDGALDRGTKSSLSAIIDGNMTIIIVAIILLLVFGQLKFAGNINESVNTIYLKNSGAKFYGFVNIIMTILCFFCTVLISVYSMSDFWTFVPLIGFFGLSVIKYVFGAVFGLKYSKYIRDFSDSYKTKELNANFEESTSDIIVCKTCGKPLKHDDYFCNHCGTPVKK